jgi:creatinine amidohydrolase
VDAFDRDRGRKPSRCDRPTDRPEGVKMDLTEATWTDVDAAETDRALVPVGSTEQHGPHAPLGTDRFAAEAVARAGATVHEETVGTPVVVTPAVPIGVSEEHRDFPGTMWVSTDTFRAYVRETVLALTAHGLDRVVFVNGHGGNVDALREVAARLTRDGDACAVSFTWFDHVDGPPMGHAGPRETALLRAVTPETVQEDRVETASEGASDRWGEWAEGVNLAHDSAAFTDNGVVGDPAAPEATAETGAAMLDAAAQSLSNLLGAVADRDWPAGDDD